VVVVTEAEVVEQFNGSLTAHKESQPGISKMPSNFLTPFLELDDEFCKVRI